MKAEPVAFAEPEVEQGDWVSQPPITQQQREAALERAAFYAKTDPPPQKTNEPRAPSATDNVLNAPPPVITLQGGDVVTAVWGKELYSPKQFHTYEVGPFTMMVTIKPGQTRAQALDEASAELEEFGKRERVRKRAAYLAALNEK